MKSKYFSYIKQFYPEFEESSRDLISDNLISPFKVELPRSLLQQAQSLIQTLYNLRENEIYQKNLAVKLPMAAQWNPGNKSICMSYDFHITSDGNLKLIEVNTNASFLLMGYFLYLTEQLPQPISDFTLNELNQNIFDEYKLNYKNIDSGNLSEQNDNCIKRQNPLTIAIIDEAPSSQKLYFEFLLYKQLFKSFGHQVLILDPSELKLNTDNAIVVKSQPHTIIDFIYNRSTDFYLEQPAMETIKLSYLNKKITLSPNPHEYSLLADKERLIEWSLICEKSHDTILSPFQSTNLNIYENLKNHKSLLLETFLLSENNSSYVWANKKKYFIKPLNSYGSKGSYRGEGISRTLFDQLIGKNFLAQEFCPAPEQIFSADGIDPIKLKYDLRFYAYQDRVQMAVARLYQGQLTNLKTKYGGFAPLIFK